ncbi:hypothetical protein [Phycicoccus avicenniae]|uniref:hypothetical protein n=1 Tax=Phycicoccus avicenniae TaxID=2828860 RepID=UPI003D27876F
MARTGGSRGVALGVVDQALSSASNVLVLLAVARTSDIELFGLVAVLFLAVSTALAATRGSLGTPILLTGGREEAGYRTEVTGALVAALAVGLAVGVLVAVVGVLVGSPLVGAVLGLSLPVVLLEDVARFAALARGDQLGAVVWDGVWALGSVLVFLATVVRPDGIGPVTVIGVWGLLGLLAAVGLAMRGRLSLRRPSLGSWWRRDGSGRLQYGTEGLLGAVSSLAVVSGASLLIGADASAALRGAGTLLGPLSVVMAAVPLAVVPRAARASDDPARTWATLRRIGFALTGLALTVCLVALVLPDAVGRLLLGDTWSVAGPLLPITGLEYAGLAWISVTYTLLRSHGQSRTLLRTRVVHSVASLVLALGAAAVWGTAPAVAWALVVTAAGVALLVRRMARPEALLAD